jgi:hypothetical protein
MIGSSVAVATIDDTKALPQDRIRRLQFHWRSTPDGVPQNALPDSDLPGSRPDGSTVYWPLSGISLCYNDSKASSRREDSSCFAAILGVHAAHIKYSPKNDVDERAGVLAGKVNKHLSFRVLKSAIALVANPYAAPDYWEWKWLLFPEVLFRATNRSVYWMSIFPSGKRDFAIIDEYVYIIGICKGVDKLEPLSINEDPFAFDSGAYNILARLRSSDLLANKLERTEVLCVDANSGSSKWRPLYKSVELKAEDTTNLVMEPFIPLPSVSTEASVAYLAESDEWIFVSMNIHLGLVYLCKSSKIVSKSWRCSEIRLSKEEWFDSDQFMYYAAKMHAEFIPAQKQGRNFTDIVVTYLTNIRGETNELFKPENYGGYTPKFLRIGF